MGHWQVLTLCLRPLPHQHPFSRRSVKYPSLNSLSNWGWQEMSCCCGWAVCSVHPAMCAHAKTKDAVGLFHYHFPPYPIETRSLTEGDANISSELLEPTCPHHLPPPPTPGGGVTSHTQLSHGCWEFKHGTSCLHKQVLSYVWRCLLCPWPWTSDPQASTPKC